MIRWATDVGKKNGFVVVIKKSDSGYGVRKPGLTLACECSGLYREDKRTRNVSGVVRNKEKGTKKCECSFQLKGKKLPTNNDWLLLVVCGVHNHHGVDHLESHSFVGRLSDRESSLLKDVSKSNVRPKYILCGMKQRDALNTTTITAIYNAQAKQKREEKASRSHMQNLLG